MKTKISVLSHWYNEELLAPLFFNHYRDMDEVRILLETDTNDSTRDIATKYQNVVIQDVHCPDGMDNIQILDNINKAILEVKDGWIYVVDADEFIFPEWHENPRTFLERQTTDIVMCLYFHAYRHITDKDIDYEKEPVPQRLHARGGANFRDQFVKPSVFKASANVILTVGNHGYIGEHSVSNERYIGAHWKQADYEICIRRRLSNGERHSQADRKKGYGNHDYYITRKRLERTLRTHSKFPELHYFTERR